MSETPKKSAPATDSPKSSPTKKEIDTATQALNHFAQGKRHLVVGDIPSAVNSLQEACRFLAEEYGETAPECGDAYYHYGQALLELARIENGVLGNALDGVPEGEDMDNSQVGNPEDATESDKEMVTTEVGKALEENYQSIQDKQKTMKAKSVSNDQVEKLKEGENAEKSSPSTSNVNTKLGKDSDADSKEKAEVEVVSQDADASVMESDSSLDNTKDSGLGTEAELKLAENIASTKLSNGSDGECIAQEGEETNLKKEGSTEDEEEEGDGDEVEEDGDGEGDDAEVGEGEKTKDGESKDEDGNKEENGSQGSGEGEKTEEDEEEVSNLQLAWEMLELAKVIFQKQEEGNPEMGKKVAQVYLKLGEVGVESENYPQGIEDFKQCLKVQERILEEDDRCLAETHYQLGVAHSFSDDFDMAMEGFTAAIEVIELRINNLNKRKKEKESWTEEQRTKDAAERPDPFYTEQGEIDELNLLLPEIKEKIIDMQQMKNDTKEKLQKAAKEAMKAQQIAGKTRVNPFGESSSSGFDAPSSGFDAPSSSTSSGASAAKPITHLVRKKQRKAEEDDKEEDQKKKVRGENGEAVPVKSETENTNGQAEKMDTNEESTKKTTKDLKKKVADDKKKREEIAQKDTKA